MNHDDFCVWLPDGIVLHMAESMQVFPLGGILWPLGAQTHRLLGIPSVLLSPIMQEACCRLTRFCYKSPSPLIVHPNSSQMCSIPAWTTQLCSLGSQIILLFPKHFQNRQPITRMRWPDSACLLLHSWKKGCYTPDLLHFYKRYQCNWISLSHFP